MNIFYTQPSDVFGNQFRLTGQEARHATKALRMGVGDTIMATDGKGKRYQGTVASVGKEVLTAAIEKVQETPRTQPQLTLAMGIIKKRDRLEFAAEKAVELGVSRILFFRADHSEKTNIRLDRLENICLSAMKQSLRSWLPEVSLMDSMEDVLNNSTDHYIRMAHEKTEDGKPWDSSEVDNRNHLLLVGPEGGFSDREVQLTRTAGGELVFLGDYRLRAETAALRFISDYRL